MTGLLLDTDIGSDIDDAMALLLCLRLPTVEMVGVTSVYGQAELRAKIARKLLRLAGRDVPVAAGGGEPISSPMAVWHAGTEGQGILDESDIDCQLDEMDIQPDAADLLIRLAREHPGSLELVSIGPLTNVAGAIRRDPEFAGNVRRLWAMVAGVSYPDPPPDRPLLAGEKFVAQPSHNVRCDVGAARVVIDSGIPMVMVGNDVTTRVRIDLERIARIEALGDPLSLAVVRMMRVWLDYRAAIFGRPVAWTCLHDALVVAEACGMGFTERDRVDVDLRDDGTTIVTGNPMSPIEVCRTVRAEAFERWYLDTVCGEADSCDRGNRQESAQ